VEQPEQRKRMRSFMAGLRVGVGRRQTDST
jgi:hypothetical protein